MEAPHDEFYNEDQGASVLADVRGLLHEYRFLGDRDAETVRQMLLMTRGLVASEFDVAVALEGITVEEGVLS